MGYIKDRFLNEVKETFWDRLNNGVELLNEYFDEETQLWDAEKIKAGDDVSLDDALTYAIAVEVEGVTVYTVDCWNICQDEIGCDNFVSYNDIGISIINIKSLAVACLSSIARYELDANDLFKEWVACLNISPEPSDV